MTRAFAIRYTILGIKLIAMDEKAIKQEFDQQGKLLMRIIELLEGNLLTKPIWDNSDVKRFLNISDSSIKRYRKEKKFKPFYIGRSPRYYRDEIIPFKNEFLK